MTASACKVHALMRSEYNMTEQVVDTTQFEVIVTHTISASFCSTVLITAFDANYGGCWDWASPANDDWLKVLHKGEAHPDGTVCIDDLWMEVAIMDTEDDPDFDRDEEHEVYIVNHLSIAKGIREILQGNCLRDDLMEQIRRSVSEDDPDIDAEAASCIVQQAVLGGLTYS